MRLCQKTLSPLLRFLAGLALLVFVAAQTLCFVHCNFGTGSESGTLPGCHGSPQHAAAQGGHDGSEPSAPSPTLGCSTLKTMLTGSDTPTLPVFQAHTLYLLSPLAFALDEAEIQPQAAFALQVRSPERVFTPEVCLGPAFRSLAPPFVG